jgi:hypothetical protein
VFKQKNGGVEIMKKRIIIGLLALSLILVLAVTAWATSGTVPINVTYRDIKIVSNGNAVTADATMGEPFIYNGRTYLPIRMAAEALGLQVDWLDWANMVTITGSSSAQEVAALKAEIADLKEQLAEARDSGSGDLDDLEEQLIDDYDTIGDVDIEDITLDGDEDEVDVTIEVDLADFDSEWADLSDSDIEDWIDDLVSDIQDEFSEDTVVNGVITDIDSDDDLVDFYKDGEDDLEVDFNDEDYRDGGSSSDADDVENDLEGTSYEVGGIDFNLSTVNYDEDDDSVTANLFADDPGADVDWEDLSSGTIESDVIDICEDIVNAFEDADISIDTIDISFYDDEEIFIDSFDYDESSGDLE